MSQSIFAKIAAAHFVANEQQVELMARERATAFETVRNGEDTYLRVVITAMQSQLGRSRRGKADKESQLSVLETVSDRYFAAVLRGVTTPDIALEPGLEPKEQSRRTRARNSRTAFARSTKSTIKTYITGGGDVRAIEVESVSKAFLRKAVAPPEPTDRVQRQVHNTRAAMLRALVRRAKADPDGARDDIEATMEDLRAVLEQLDDAEPSPEPAAAPRPERSFQRTRVGVPTFPQHHRSAAS